MARRRPVCAAALERCRRCFRRWPKAEVPGRTAWRGAGETDLPRGACSEAPRAVMPQLNMALELASIRMRQVAVLATCFDDQNLSEKQPMRRLHRVVSTTVLIALCVALAGCSSSMSSFDPMDMLDFLDTKKKLPGDRK